MGGGKRLSHAEEVRLGIVKEEPLIITNPYISQESLIRAVETTAIEGVRVKIKPIKKVNKINKIKKFIKRRK